MKEQTAKLQKAESTLSFMDPVSVKKIREHMASGHHTKNKSLHSDYCLYPVNWEKLDLDEVKGMCPEAQPPKPPTPLEPEIKAKTLLFNANADDRETNRLSLIAASRTKDKSASDVSSANNFLLSLMGGDDKPDAPVTAKWPSATLSKHTCAHLMAFDEGSNPAPLETYLEEPNTNPELKKVAEHVIKIRSRIGLGRSFIELPYDKQRDFENLTTDGQKFLKEPKSAKECAVWGNYGDNSALLSPPEMKKAAWKLTLPRPLAVKLVEENNLKGTKIATSTHAQYARALRNFDGVRGHKYEWTPPTNTTQKAPITTPKQYSEFEDYQHAIFQAQHAIHQGSIQ